MLVADHCIVPLPSDELTHTAARTPSSPGLADPHTPQHVDGHPGCQKLAAEPALKAEPKIGLHLRTQTPQIGQGDKESLDSAVHVPGVQVQHADPAIGYRCRCPELSSS